MKKNFHIFCFFALLLIQLSACKSTKKIQGDTAERSKSEILQGIEGHNIDYEWFTAVGKVRMKSEDQNIAVKVYLRVHRDSAIWMVVKKLGIEFARVLITPEEFTIIYRMENVYEQEDLQTVLSSYDADFTLRQLQDYLVGNLPSLDEEALKFRENEDEIVCQTTIENMRSFLRLATKNLDLNGFEIFNSKNESAKGSFTDYQEVNDYRIPFGRKFELQSLEYGMLSIDFNMSEIQIDEPKGMRFSVPKHYEKLKYYRPF